MVVRVVRGGFRGYGWSRVATSGYVWLQVVTDSYGYGEGSAIKMYIDLLNSMIH